MVYDIIMVNAWLYTFVKPVEQATQKIMTLYLY